MQETIWVLQPTAACCLCMPGFLFNATHAKARISRGIKWRTGSQKGVNTTKLTSQKRFRMQLPRCSSSHDAGTICEARRHRPRPSFRNTALYTLTVEIVLAEGSICRWVDEAHIIKHEIAHLHRIVTDNDP